MLGFKLRIDRPVFAKLRSGNIRGLTRTMTTAIALETSKGDLPLALGLGMILIALTIGVSTAAFLLAGETERR